LKVPDLRLQPKAGWRPITRTGDALADVLTGKSYPSGKLTMTWASIARYASTEGFSDPNDTDYLRKAFM
jgi:beta-glucosidase